MYTLKNVYGKRNEKDICIYLFVYGSLKKGFDNHDLLKKDAILIGEAETVKKFGLFEDSFGNYPYLTDRSSEHRVKGELYKIRCRRLLTRIDKFEGHPDFYQRKRILVRSGNHFVRAYAYIRDVAVGDNEVSLREWRNQSDVKLEALRRYFHTNGNDATI